MQDQITIASRNCTDTEKDLFNKINKKFQKIFDANNVLLEVFFQKFASDNPINAMNNFITENANSASLKSIYNKKVFCQKQNFTMEQLLKSDSNKIGYIANKNITQEISNPKKCESD